MNDLTLSIKVYDNAGNVRATRKATIRNATIDGELANMCKAFIDKHAATIMALSDINFSAIAVNGANSYSLSNADNATLGYIELTAL